MEKFEYCFFEIETDYLYHFSQALAYDGIKAQESVRPLFVKAKKCLHDDW